MGSLGIVPNLNGLSVLGLKLNKPSVLDLVSSVLENNEVWVEFDDSVAPEAVNDPNIDEVFIVEGRPNKFVDLVSSVLVESKEKFPKIGLDPKIGVLDVLFSKMLVEDLSPKRNDVVGKDCDVLFVVMTGVIFDSETLTGSISCSVALSISYSELYSINIYL